MGDINDLIQAPEQEPEQLEEKATAGTATEAATDDESLGYGDQATPDEQDAFERVVLAGMKILYDDKTHDKIVKMLKGDGDPAVAVANVSAMVITQLDDQAGGNIPEAVILPAAAHIMEMTAELVSEVGEVPFDESDFKRAEQVLVVKLAEEYGVAPEEIQGLIDSIDPAEVQAMVAEQQQYAGQPEEPQQAEPQQPAEQAPQGPPPEQQQPGIVGGAMA